MFSFYPISSRSYEVNLAATDSALTIAPHYCHIPECDTKALRVSMYILYEVQLMHALQKPKLHFSIFNAISVLDGAIILS